MLHRERTLDICTRFPSHIQLHLDQHVLVRKLPKDGKECLKRLKKKKTLFDAHTVLAIVSVPTSVRLENLIIHRALVRVLRGVLLQYWK